MLMFLIKEREMLSQEVPMTAGQVHGCSACSVSFPVRIC